MDAEARVTGKRQITIPKEVYELMGLKNTDKIVFEKGDNDEVIIKKKEINSTNICPVCEREVVSDDTMVVKQGQRYHLACCEIGNKLNEDYNSHNKLTKTQKETLRKISVMKNEKYLNMIKELKDNEAVVNLPVKITFMPNKPGVIGSISGVDTKDVFACSTVSKSE